MASFQYNENSSSVEKKGSVTCGSTNKGDEREEGSRLDIEMSLSLLTHCTRSSQGNKGDEGQVTFIYFSN